MIIITFAAIAALVPTEFQKVLEREPPVGMVYYVTSQVAFTTGLHEDEMEEVGCYYTINRKQFLGWLKKSNRTNNRTNNRHYEPLDVRAKIVFKNEDTYFMDRFGFVRHGNSYWKINKMTFEHAVVIFHEDQCH